MENLGGCDSVVTVKGKDNSNLRVADGTSRIATIEQEVTTFLQRIHGEIGLRINRLQKGNDNNGRRHSTIKWRIK